MFIKRHSPDAMVWKAGPRLALTGVGALQWMSYKRPAPIGGQPETDITMKPGPIYRVHTGIALHDGANPIIPTLLNVQPTLALYREGLLVEYADVDLKTGEILVYVQARAEVKLNRNSPMFYASVITGGEQPSLGGLREYTEPMKQPSEPPEIKAVDGTPPPTSAAAPPRQSEPSDEAKRRAFMDSDDDVEVAVTPAPAAPAGTSGLDLESTAVAGVGRGGSVEDGGVAEKLRGPSKEAEIPTAPEGAAPEAKAEAPADSSPAGAKGEALF